MFRHILATRRDRRVPVKPAASSRRRRMTVESLEGRQLLAMDFNAAIGLGGMLSARAVAADSAGDTYVTGGFGGTVNFNPAGTASNLTSTGTRDIFLAKYSPTGSLIWAKDLTGAAAQSSYGNSLVVDAGGDVILGGQIAGSVAFGPGVTLTAPGTATDGAVAKYSPTGALLWARAYDNGSSELVNSLAVDASGNLYAAGNFGGTGGFGRTAGGAAVTLAAVGGGTNAFALKLDASGNSVWAAGVGGAGYEQGKRIAVDAAGNVVLAGSMTATANIGNLVLNSTGNLSVFIAKFGATGVPLWATELGGTGADQVGGLAVDGSGNVFVGGTFAATAAFGGGNSLTTPTLSTPQAFVTKLSAAGVDLWAHQLDATGGASVNDLHTDSLGNVYAGGNFSGNFTAAATATLYSAGGSDPFVDKLDTNGVYQWAKSAGGPGTDTLAGLAVSAPDVVKLVGGFTGPAAFGGTTLAGSGLYNFFVSQVSNVVATGARAVGFAAPTFGLGGFTIDTYATAVDAAGDTYATGDYRGTVNFNPGGAAVNLTPGGLRDIYLAKYSPTGALIWVKGLTGGNSLASRGNALVVDSAGNVILGGQISGPVTFGPGVTLTAPGTAADGAVAKYDANGNLLWARAYDNGSSELVNSLAVDAAGNLYAAGNFGGTGGFGRTAGGAAVTLAAVGGGTNAFALKLDASGNSVWAAGVGGAGYEQGKRIAVDAAGNVDVAGTFTATAVVNGFTQAIAPGGSLNDFVAQLNGTNGAAKWLVGLGGAGSESLGGLAVDGAGNLFVGGYFSGTAAFGSHALTASTAGQSEAFVTKLSSAGVDLWAEQLGSTSGASVNDLRTDGSGNVYAGGNFSGTGNFNPGGTATLYSAGGSDAFVASLDTNGVYRWALRAGGPGTDTVTALAVAGVDDLEMVGAFASPAVFGGTTLAGTSLTNAFVSRVSF